MGSTRDAYRWKLTNMYVCILTTLNFLFSCLCSQNKMIPTNCKHVWTFCGSTSENVECLDHVQLFCGANLNWINLLLFIPPTSHQAQNMNTNKNIIYFLKNLSQEIKSLMFKEKEVPNIPKWQGSVYKNPLLYGLLWALAAIHQMQTHLFFHSLCHAWSTLEPNIWRNNFCIRISFQISLSIGSWLIEGPNPIKFGYGPIWGHIVFGSD